MSEVTARNIKVWRLDHGLWCGAKSLWFNVRERTFNIFWCLKLV